MDVSKKDKQNVQKEKRPRRRVSKTRPDQDLETVDADVSNRGFARCDCKAFQNMGLTSFQTE